MAWFGLGRKRAEIAELREQLNSRAIGGVPWVDNNPAVPFGSGGPAHPSRIAQGVDGALSLAPIYGACRVLADGVASLPVQVYIGAHSQTQATRWNGPSLFDKPSAFPHTTTYDWLFQAMTSLVLEGNAFGFIASRDGMGFPTTIEWLAPSTIWIDEDVDKSPMSAKYYQDGRHIPTEDLLHIRAFTVAGRVRGISPLKAFASLVSQGNYMTQYGNDWFAQGGFPPGIFRNINVEIDAEQAEEIKGNLSRSLRSRRPLVIGADWEYTPVKVPPSEAQFVEATRMNATQIAAIYGVPPERIGGTRGDSLTYANQEQASISFVTDTLRPWLVRLENAFFGILPAKRYVRFNSDAMVKTDLKTRHEVFLLDRQMGIKNTDEIRDIDDLAPLPNGLGTDTLPLLIAQDLVRSGKAIPSLYKDEITVLQVAPGATPGTPATQTQETPQNNATAPPPKTTKAPVIQVGRSQPPDRLQPPGKAPKTRSVPVCSLDDVALLWAGQQGLDVAACRAEAGMHARRGGLQVRAYDAKILDQGQYEWLLSMCRASENPVPCATLIPNGKRPGG